jgi:hypothetical protein
LLLLHGPIAQSPAYHAFADTRTCLGVVNAADVLSNAGFAVVGLWGLFQLWPLRRQLALAAAWPGYLQFFIALILTSVGTSFYHLAPDNDRLVWDRLLIALVCAGLLIAVRAETRPNINAWLWCCLLSVVAILSVVWWYVTEWAGHGDLRPYLLLQGLPVVLIPMWQTMAFGIAILLYIAAKVAELHDHQLLAMLGLMSGHTLKHLLATAAAAVMTSRLIKRVGSVRLA